MRDYEIAVIMSPELEEAQRSGLRDTVKDWIVSCGGDVVSVDEMGKRKLSYHINNKREGYYVSWYAQIPSDGPSAIERQLSIHENILRYMIIRSEIAINNTKSTEIDSQDDNPVNSPIPMGDVAPDIEKIDVAPDIEKIDVAPDIEKIVDDLMEKEENEEPE